MRFIDVHCHFDGWCGDISGLFEKLRTAHIEKIIASGVDLPTSQFNAQLAKTHDMCYFTAGFHPTELKNYRKGDLSAIEELCACEKCVAVGEIGLDYHYPDTDKALQRRIFGEQLELADKLGLPVQIHSRDCAEDMLAMLKEYGSCLKRGALMHCYSHSPEIARELEKLNMYFSFGGMSTYSGSKRARKSIASISQDRLLTETDSPYCPPVSKKGEFPNTPLSIPEICANMADIRGVSVEEQAETVWENAHRLFKKLR